jgi:hypothetical protein
MGNRRAEGPANLLGVERSEGRGRAGRAGSGGSDAHTLPEVGEVGSPQVSPRKRRQREGGED